MNYNKEFGINPATLEKDVLGVTPKQVLSEIKQMQYQKQLPYNEMVLTYSDLLITNKTINN